MFYFNVSSLHSVSTSIENEKDLHCLAVEIAPIQGGTEDRNAFLSQPLISCLSAPRGVLMLLVDTLHTLSAQAACDFYFSFLLNTKAVMVALISCIHLGGNKYARL
mmetsp:Transcript_11785/g.34604  ORF Transcript_11785/g.34604 Transcript_11785/m.34604 type:complete len:106 (-) Transcript_11785:1016-1333(-)